MQYQVFDTTLRDGGQREGISYSVADKLAVARLLDEFGVGFIEGGWPGAMPKDTEFFQRAKTELDLKNAVLVAFGATRKAGVEVTADAQVKALLDAETPVVCVVAKSDIRHVERALRTAGIEPHTVMEMTSTEAIKQAVEANGGVGILARAVVQRDVRGGHLRAVPVRGGDLTLELAFAYHRERADSPLLRAVLEVVVGPV